MKSEAISREQVRAARSLLDWTQDDLAGAASVATKTIADFERGERQPQTRTLRDIREALEQAGIQFIPANGGGVGVRLRK